MQTEAVNRCYEINMTRGFGICISRNEYERELKQIKSDELSWDKTTDGEINGRAEVLQMQWSLNLNTDSKQIN